MLSIHALSETLEERYINFFKHIFSKKGTEDSEWIYDPTLYPLTPELYANLFTLSQEEFLKLEVHLNFRIQLWLNSVKVHETEVKLDTNWLGSDFLERMYKLEFSPKTSRLLLHILNHPVIIVPNLSLFYCRTFYNWFCHNFNHESVLLSTRTTMCKVNSPLMNYNFNRAHKGTVLHKETDNDFDFINMITGEAFHAIEGKFYIVTESTADCKIKRAELYDVLKHSQIELDDTIRGMIFKFTGSGPTANLNILSNKLHCNEFPYDLQLLGLKVVK